MTTWPELVATESPDVVSLILITNAASARRMRERAKRTDQAAVMLRHLFGFEGSRPARCSRGPVCPRKNLFARNTFWRDAG